MAYRYNPARWDDLICALSRLRVNATRVQTKSGRQNVFLHMPDGTVQPMKTSTLSTAGWVRCPAACLGIHCTVDEAHSTIGQRVACLRCGEVSDPLPADVLTALEARQ